MSRAKFKSLNAPFGKEVLGVNLQSVPDLELLAELTRGLMEHKILLIRNQALDPGQFAAFGRAWSGKTRIDSFKEMHVPGFDDMNIIGNVGTLFSDANYRNGAAFWHTDCAAEKKPDATTMLYCIHALSSGGATILADMELAYSDLESNMKRTIEPLVARHCYAGATTILGGNQNWEHKLTPVSEETRQNFPDPVERPLVRRHSVTGRKGLYAPAGSIFEIQGMADDEANQLMYSLKQHATQEKYCYRHQYQPGDVLIWDNTSTMHHGEPISAATTDNDRRLLHRMSPLGLPFGTSLNG